MSSHLDAVASQPLITVLRSRLVWAVNLARRSLTPAGIRKFEKLHLGAGSRYLPGWGNVDLRGTRNLIWDLTKPLPMAASSVRFVYSEHFIEHIPKGACRKLLENARAALSEDGVLRVSTPDLRWWAATYLKGETVQHDHAGWHPASPCEMLNDQMRRWGHQVVYDELELVELLKACGFSRVERVRRGESRYAELRDLESRPDCGDLILEARR